MKKIDKIAVFDLDGTLWKINSHYEILNLFYSTNFYKSFVFRLFSHFFRKTSYSFIWKQYKKIPVEFINGFNPDFNPKYIELLDEKRKEGFYCIIISNAPFEIVQNAAKRLSIPFLRASVSKKLETLKKEYQFEQLFVCTDNIEDIDLIENADFYEIVETKNNVDFFKEKGLIK